MTGHIVEKNIVIITTADHHHQPCQSIPHTSHNWAAQNNKNRSNNDNKWVEVAVAPIISKLFVTDVHLEAHWLLLSQSVSHNGNHHQTPLHINQRNTTQYYCRWRKTQTKEKRVSIFTSDHMIHLRREIIGSQCYYYFCYDWLLDIKKIKKKTKENLWRVRKKIRCC